MAANYLPVGQIYLFDNPLLREPLTLAHIKKMLLGYWGTTPSQNFIHTHLNRVIKAHDLDMVYLSGPGHGGPAVVASTYLEGTYGEVYPNISQDEAGLKRPFTQAMWRTLPLLLGTLLMPLAQPGWCGLAALVGVGWLEMPKALQRVRS